MARQVVAVLLTSVAFAACNTVEDVGKDLKAGGQAIEKVADKNKAY